MSKILIAGAGGAPTEGVIRSLMECQKNEEIIGMGSEPFDLMTSAAVRKYQVPYSVDPTYRQALMRILKKEKPDLIHFQNDIEIREASAMRDDILSTGVKLYMPNHDVILNCVDKGASYNIWEKAGIRLPKTMLIMDEKDLKKSFETLGNKDGKIWLRAVVGGGGRGALPTAEYEFAKFWIERFNGWGNFTAAELLTPDSVTWLSIWYRGELVVAQGRKRLSWNFGNRTISGVTGVTGVGQTISDPVVDGVAQDAILAIDKCPHGIYGVDMTYDDAGLPNPTEINISRFFTTVHFFTQAGLNMPKIFKDIALYDEFPSLDNKINPLPEGLLWLRGMDRKPVLTTMTELKANLEHA